MDADRNLLEVLSVRGIIKDDEDQIIKGNDKLYSFPVSDLIDLREYYFEIVKLYEKEYVLGGIKTTFAESYPDESYMYGKDLNFLMLIIHVIDFKVMFGIRYKNTSIFSYRSGEMRKIEEIQEKILLLIKKNKYISYYEILQSLSEIDRMDLITSLENLIETRKIVYIERQRKKSFWEISSI